jgi:UDP-glucose 4-epimerase
VKKKTGSPHALPAAADVSSQNVMATDKLRALGWRPGGWPLFRETVQEMLRETRRSP